MGQACPCWEVALPCAHALRYRLWQLASINRKQPRPPQQLEQVAAPTVPLPALPWMSGAAQTAAAARHIYRELWRKTRDLPRRAQTTRPPNRRCGVTDEQRAP